MTRRWLPGDPEPIDRPAISGAHFTTWCYDPDLGEWVGYQRGWEVCRADSWLFVTYAFSPLVAA